MYGVAVVVCVRPDDVTQCSSALACFEPLLPHKCNDSAYVRIRFRHPRLRENPHTWLSDRDFGIALISLQDLSLSEFQKCERQANAGTRVAQGAAMAQWIANVRIPVSNQGSQVVDLESFVLNFDPVIVSSVGNCLRLLQHASYSDGKRRKLNNAIQQFTNANEALDVVRPDLVIDNLRSIGSSSSETSTLPPMAHFWFSSEFQYATFLATWFGQFWTRHDYRDIQDFGSGAI
jgi:hypothetical protein